MAFKDMMPWGRGGRQTGLGALEGMRGLLDAMELALQEPWSATGARLFGGDWLPRVDVSETEKEVAVTASLPGLSREDIHVSASEDALSIRGVKKTQGKERETYSFYRSLTLPSTVRPDEARAAYKDDVLTVTLPKAKHSQVKRVAIH